jgi:hypothetical protein
MMGNPFLGDRGATRRVIDHHIWKMAASWDIEPCSQVKPYQHFRGACRLHHQGNEQATQLTVLQEYFGIWNKCT